MNSIAPDLDEPTSHPATRQAITTAATQPEQQSVCRLLAETELTPDQQRTTADLATTLITALRARGTRGPVEALMREYALSSAEGIALMCLAEALLRTPDGPTRDALIRDRIAAGDWRAHVGRSPSLFVNAASWGLLVTGKLTATADEAGLARALASILGRGGQPVIRRALDLSMRLMGEHFVLGQTIGSALTRARRLEARGFRYSYDMLGEGALTGADAADYAEAYHRAIAAIATAATRSDPLDRPGISIKLSALHPRYHRNQRARVLTELTARVASLARQAADGGIGLNIDAEEADRLDLSLDLLERLCFDRSIEGAHSLGFVVQAYGKRATAVIDHLTDLARRSGRRLAVRLVKGAYWDSEIKRAQENGVEFPVFTRKAHTDLSYIACARRMLAAPDEIYPQFATHNARTLATIHTLAGPGAPRDAYEFQCLHGMGEALYEEVVGPAKLNRPCRIYAPVGSHETLLPYLVRRLLENGANTSFVNRLGDETVLVTDLAADPRDLVLAADPPGSPHPSIRHPSALFAPERLNASGHDLADEATRAALLTALRTAAPTQEPPPPFDPAQLDATIAAARSSAWRHPRTDRATPLERAADLLEERAPSLLALFATEGGKTIPNALAEIREAVDFLRFYAARSRDADGEPLGTVACISPWNFPLAIFVGQVSAALAAGNAVLAKPAEQTPRLAALAVTLLHEAGIPPDALTLLTGDGTLGATLVSHPGIDAVAFTGSTDTARTINRALAARTARHGAPIPFIAETGGQNVMIVDSTALPEQVVTDVLSSAFDSAGQRCSALRILCLQNDIAPRILRLLEGAADELVLGDPARLQTDIGPVITQDAADAIETHLAAMTQAGLTVRRFGRIAGDDPRLVRPALVHLDRLDRLTHEVFGPVLHVLTYARDDLPALLRAIDATGFALTFGVHTRLDETVERVEAAQSAGNMYVNRNMIGAVVGSQPFGGHRLSGTGPKAGGPLTLRRLQKGGAPLADTAPHDLPGPAGERNLYRLEPRGRILCHATTAQAARTQLELVFLTGNTPTAEPGYPCPPDLATRIEPFTGHAEAALVDADPAALGRLAEHLAALDGPIIPLHTPPYAPEWLLRERVNTTNTAAAGGNASLMAIG